MPKLPAKHSRAYQELGARMREARQAAGLTQAQASRAVGRPQSFISKTESGERRIDVVELAVLARLYGKSLQDFELDGS